MKSYFRFLWKHKSLTLIQILGVSLGLSFAIPAVSLLVKLWQMDHDNPEYRNIYGVCTAQTMSFASEDDYLVDTYPEVEDAVMFMTSKCHKTNDVINKDVRLTARTMYCNPDITGFFPLEMIAGSIESLALDNRIILSKEFAANLSENDLMGSVLTVNDKEYVVGGIYDSFDSQKIPFADIILGLNQHFDRMKEIFSYTFVRLKDGTDGEKFEEKLRSNETERFASNLNTNVANVDIRLVRYDRMSTNGHFYNLTSLPSTLAVLLVSALILLFLMAIFNFTNLSISMSTRRSREMATRQLLGSTKSDIWKQVFHENIVFTAVCFITGMLLAFAMSAPLKFLYSLADEYSSLSSIAFSPAALVSYALLIVVVGVLTGIAPARSITRFSALDVVKGEFRAKEKSFLSKALIVFHGVLTVAIVFLTLVEMAQVRHNSRIDFGCDIDDVCFVSLIDLTDAEKEYVFQTLSNKPYVSSMGYSGCLPGNFITGMKFGDDVYDILDCDQGAFDAFGFRVKEDLASRGKSTLWLSESLKERLAGRDLTGNEMSGVGADVVGGTVETVLMNSRRMLYPTVYPVVVVEAVSSPSGKNFLVLKTTGDHKEVSEDISKTVTSALYDNSGTVKNTVCDYVRDNFYRENFWHVESILKLMKVYALFMLILSLLGILGISTYNMQVRRHDMAVRKVFGSSTKAEVLRNVRSYSILMLIANAIGLPAGFKLAPLLNSNLVSKVAISPWMFVVTFLFTMLAVICVCLVQSWYTASANPVDSIKSE